MEGLGSDPQWQGGACRGRGSGHRVGPERVRRISPRQGRKTLAVDTCCAQGVPSFLHMVPCKRCAGTAPTPSGSKAPPPFYPSWASADSSPVVVATWAGPGLWAKLAGCVDDGLTTRCPGNESRHISFPPGRNRCGVHMTPDCPRGPSSPSQPPLPPVPRLPPVPCQSWPLT